MVELGRRLLIAEICRRDVTFRSACICAPNQNPERNSFVTSCLDFVDMSVTTILWGDFNAVFDRTKDRRGSDPSVTVRESFVSLNLLFRECCAIDFWRHLHRNVHAFTWLKSAGSVFSQIDLIGYPCCLSSSGISLRDCVLPFF